MNFENLTPEMQAKVKACKTAEEILELAKEEGYELSDAELEGIAGGNDFWSVDWNWCSNKGPCANWFPK